MNRKALTAALMLACCGFTGALAQNPQGDAVAIPAPAAPLQAAPASPFAPVAAPAVLRVGTEVAVRLSETLTSKDNQSRVDQRFRIEIAEDVRVGGRTVIPAGSTGVGEVTEVKNKGMWGQSGRLSARLLYVQVSGRQIRLTGSFNERGQTGTAGVVGAIVFIPVAGFLVTGTSATLPAGSIVKGFIDEDVPLAFTVAAPVPLAVPAPASAPPAIP